MIETEKATNRYDLPHKPEVIEFASLMCVCGRTAEDELHTLVRETAGQRSVLQTEKGS